MCYLINVYTILLTKSFTNGLIFMCLSLWFFSFHRHHWPVVMQELCTRTPRIDDNADDDDGYQTENWDDECDAYASFLDHRKLWAGVMTELGMMRPVERVNMEIAMGCNAMGKPRQQPANIYAAFVKHRDMWPAVMKEVQLFKSRSTIELEMLTGRNAEGELLQRSRSAVRRPTKLLDRRGRSLTRLNFY